MTKHYIIHVISTIAITWLLTIVLDSDPVNPSSEVLEQEIQRLKTEREVLTVQRDSLILKSATAESRADSILNRPIETKYITIRNEINNLPPDSVSARVLDVLNGYGSMPDN